MRYKIVPVEPTEEMKAIIRNEFDVYENEDALFQDLFAAAPKASEDEALVERVAKLLAMFQLQSFQDQAHAVLEMLEGNSK